MVDETELPVTAVLEEDDAGQVLVNVSDVVRFNVVEALFRSEELLELLVSPAFELSDASIEHGKRWLALELPGQIVLLDDVVVGVHAGFKVQRALRRVRETHGLHVPNIHQ